MTSQGQTPAGDQAENKPTEPPDESPQCWGRKHFWLLVHGLVITLAPILPALCLVFVRLPVAEISKFGLIAITALLLIFHFVNVRVRIKLEHWQIEGLKGALNWEMAIGCGVPVVVLGILTQLPPTWPVFGLVALVFAAAHAYYEPLEKKIHAAVDAAGKKQGTEYFGEQQPFRIVTVPYQLKDIAAEEHGPGLQRFLTMWLKPSKRSGLSMTRTVILDVMLASCIFAGVAAGHTGGHRMFDGTGRRDSARVKSRHDQGQEPRGSTPQPVTEPPPSDPGPIVCPTLPQLGAPLWARSDLNALYYGGKHLDANPPPGSVGGCTGRAITIATPYGPFVYTVGKDEFGEILSTAVDSRLFGPAIFLAPAAKIVLTLIESGQVPLGGYPTLDVDGGDLATITTLAGTTVLIRSATHLPGQPEFAQPYVELPPPVASAWIGTVREFGSWLWPLPPAWREELQVFPLAVDSGGLKRIAVIAYDPQGNEAKRGPYRYATPQPQLGREEIEALTLGATQTPEGGVAPRR